MKPFIVIPAHDEAATIGRVVRGARAHAPVIVVDDGSHDNTAQAAALAGADLCRHPRRCGKAQALRTGVAAARERGATHVVTLDADGQHDPDDVPALLAAATPRTLVVGARQRADAALPAGRAEAVVIAGFFVNWASGLRLADTQSGFRVYPVVMFDDVPARRGGFVFETEVLLAAAAHGWTVREVPVRALPRAAARSRFRPMVDGTAIGAHLAARSLSRIAREASAAEWWRHPRRRRAAAAARAVLALPIVLPVLAVAALTGWRTPAASALVASLYAQERLDAGPSRPTEAIEALWTRS